jgi:signal transduction histidine kinase
MDRISLDRFARLIEAAAAVVGQPDLQAVLRTTVETAREHTGARYAALGVIGEHGTLVEFIHTGLEPDQAAAIGAPPVGKGVLGVLIEDPRPIRLDRIADHPASAGFPTGHPPMGAFLGVPVRVANAVFGNLYLADKENGFDEADEQAVVALAAIAGSAVASARLHDRITRVAVAEDRERIARDLHDGVIQDLFAVGLTLQGLIMKTDDPVVAERLDDAVDRIDESIAALRSFIFDIRAFAQSIVDPVRTIHRMVDRLTTVAPVLAEVDVGEIAGTTPEQLDDALGVIREAVSNAVRHAEATTIRVHVSRGTSGLMVVVTDDGCGFDPATVTRGMGLDNLAARTGRQAGEVRIESAPGVGTSVTALLRD